MVNSGPTVLKRYVALRLKALREASGGDEREVKREHVAAELGCSLGHVRHLETMVSLPKPLETRALLTMYGVPELIDSFLSLVTAARNGKDWWADLPGVPPFLKLLLGTEPAAAQIDSYDAGVVPGLFQTPAYAREIIRAGEPELPDDDVEQRINLRMARQDVLTRQPHPPTIWSVLDESVLLRPAGTAAVLAEQLDHLVKLTELANVNIQILPLSAGVTAGMNGTFTVLTFGPELVGDPGLAYTESRVAGTYYETAEQVAQYRDTFRRIHVLAHKPAETRAILARRIKEITQ